MDSEKEQDTFHLSQEQIRTFCHDGVLVVDNVLTPSQVDTAQRGLSETLARNGVDTDHLDTTGGALQNLSSTNGSGGVLDLFYEDWKMKVATNDRLFSITTQLWESAFFHCGESRSKGDLLDEENNQFKWHPYGAFNCQRGYAYVDRIGFRLPTGLAQKLGAELESAAAGTKTKKKKVTPIQRSLTPHLDCCPENLYKEDANNQNSDNPTSKWRPIQCFVSLTDNLEPNTGGFEAAKGFHRGFDAWAASREPTKITRKSSRGGQPETVNFQAPCVGEYTHMRPKEDRDVMDRIEHIPVRAGSAVFWDNRIPHANAYRHDGNIPRSVVYCSFLPDVPINKKYAAEQLENWKQGRRPTDQWINPDENGDQIEPTDNLQEKFDALSPLGRQLLAIDPW
jgi:hypothetical protein